MATLEAIQPYVEHLFDDADVRRQLARASANLSGAKSRADKVQSNASSSYEGCGGKDTAMAEAA